MLTRGGGAESAKHPPPGTEGVGNLLGPDHLNDDDDDDDDCWYWFDNNEEDAVNDDKEAVLLGRTLAPTFVYE